MTVLALMQPYFFPYIGYFQLMHAVDEFVVYDDAQFMKGGWVNRNRILLHGAPAWWTMPMQRDDYRLPIAARRYGRSAAVDGSLLGQVAGAYRDAPQYRDVAGFLAALFGSPEDNAARFNEATLHATARRLGIRCRFHRTSALPGMDGLGGQDKVLAVCRHFGADTYVNPIGGVALYDPQAFERAGVALRFLRTGDVVYPQYGAAFVPSLSIVDVMMFNEADGIGAALEQCRVLPAGAVANG